VLRKFNITNIVEKVLCNNFSKTGLNDGPQSAGRLWEHLVFQFYAKKVSPPPILYSQDLWTPPRVDQIFNFPISKPYFHDWFLLPVLFDIPARKCKILYGENDAHTYTKSLISRNVPETKHLFTKKHTDKAEDWSHAFFCDTLQGPDMVSFIYVVDPTKVQGSPERMDGKLIKLLWQAKLSEKLRLSGTPKELLVSCVVSKGYKHNVSTW
jgi:hypothetical protein